MISTGSSPRTWGTLCRRVRCCRSPRFIPTYMGNASSRSEPPTPPSVHPHVHGERMFSRRVRSGVVGSSPRTWGTLNTRNTRNGVTRFIPTYMGNAPGGRRCPVDPPVHPHVHGERMLRVLIRFCRSGSSPRTWGTRALPARLMRVVRFIPTYMGNAPGGYHPREQRPVHPHVHGERAATSAKGRRSPGSSPRTWGTRVHHRDVAALGRFIPTYMGNAVGTGGPAARNAVHPHVHGERAGSIGGGGGQRRFIPTYMGNA